MRNRSLRNMILAALLAGMTCAVAPFKLAIPFSPVPITLQVLMVMLAGGLLGAGWGAMAMVVYVLLGVAGLPVFAGAAHGPGVLVGPTGGYLMSYPIAAAVVGLLAPPGRGVLRTVGAMLLGLAVIYLGGGGWAVLWGGQALGAVVSGWVLPFIPLDLVKVGVAAVLSGSVHRALVGQGLGQTAAVRR